MSDVHARFRGALAAHLAELLADEDAAWMDAHAADCTDCAGLLERTRTRLPQLEHDAGHAPVSLLSRWLHAPEGFTSLERELLSRHLAACDLCRGDLEEMARLDGRIARVPSPARRHRLLWAASLAAAAALVVLFVPRERTPAPPADSPAGPVAAAPPATGAALEPLTLQLVAPTRAGTPTAPPEVPAPDPGAGLRLLLPALFMPPGEEVLASLHDAEGRALWEARIAATALADTLAPPTPARGWATGTYRLRLIPGAGRDTLLAREFTFRLVEPDRAR